MTHRNDVIRYMWGDNTYGRLGVGDKAARATPSLVYFPNSAIVSDDVGGSGSGGGSDGSSSDVGGDGGGGDASSSAVGRGTAADASDGGSGAAAPSPTIGVAPTTTKIVQISVGSLYSGAVAEDGRVFTWGYGGHGNLGHGSRKTSLSPKSVDALHPAVLPSLESNVPADPAGKDAQTASKSAGGGGAGSSCMPARSGSKGDVVVEIACTKGQPGCKGGLNPKQNGQEGPHTVAITKSGKM